jgi:hypothetical protein
MVDWFVTVQPHLFSKRNFTNQYKSTCFFTVHIIQSMILAVIKRFIKSVCEVQPISKKPSSSILAVDNLHSFCENSYKILDRWSME